MKKFIYDSKEDDLGRAFVEFNMIFVSNPV